jgi:hypothetical protein
MSGPYCGRCAEILPCKCLGLARAELADLVAARKEALAPRAAHARDCQAIRRIARGLVKCEEESLAVRALRKRGALR